jgi:Family of unknown function (DUF6551)
MTTSIGKATRRVKPEYRSSIEWIPVAQVTVEPKAQRKFMQRWADEIAENLDPDLLGHPLVCALSRNGTGHEHYVVIDGQHRIAAVRKALGKDQSVQCEVIHGIDLARAAALYRGRNTIRHPRPYDLFIAGRTAHDADCMEIDKIVRAHGFTVSDAHIDGTISAVTAIERVYKMAPGGAILDATLGVVTESWGSAAAGTQSGILLGLGLVLRRYGSAIDRTRLQRQLASHSGGASGLLGRGRSLTDAFGGSVGNGVARAIVMIYNTGLRQNKLPDWGS